MTKTIKLFLPKEFYDEMLYQYEEKDAELRTLVHGFLKPYGKQAKMALLHNNIQVRLIKKGKIEIEEQILKELGLENSTLSFNKDWLPEKMEKGNIEVYSLTISDRLYEDLLNFAKIYIVRLDMWNDSVNADAGEDGKIAEDRLAKLPVCFEQIIQDVTIQNLTQAVEENIDKEYDEEFTELNTPKKKE